MIILEENFKWHLEAFASELFIYKCNLFMWCEYSALLHQSSESHDPSEIILICWFAAQETFLIIINVKKQLCVMYVCMRVYVKKITGESNKWSTSTQK